MAVAKPIYRAPAAGVFGSAPVLEERNWGEVRLRTPGSEIAPGETQHARRRRTIFGPKANHLLPPLPLGEGGWGG
jgi:hypothetical protein